jgi:hypothetical protein
LSPLSAKYLALAERGQRILDQRRDPVQWIESNLTIRAKDRRLIPLILNEVQRFYYQHRTRRDIVLKARQQGITTIIEALFFAECVLRPNTTSALVAHDLDSATKIFEIARLFVAKLPPAAKRLAGGDPVRESRRELVWPNGSRLWVGSAESKAGRFGHGLTVQNLHCSEVARWSQPEEAMVALFEAVPAEGCIVLESTPNGFNHFHDLWIGAAGSRFTRFFFTWWDNPEYWSPPPSNMGALTAEERQLVERHGLSLAQIQWRREKQRDLRERFKEQYPEDDISCFLASTRAVFDLAALQQMAARIAAEAAPEVVPALPAKDGKVLGVAPARLLVWQRPQVGTECVIGADVGEGLAGGDASCAIVLERRSGEQVAELHGRVPPDRFGHLLDALGRWYNRALLAVERNNHGHSTLNTLRNVCHYPRLYCHVRYDARAGAQPVLGWPTDQSTKPILVDDLAAAIAQGAVLIHSRALIDELMTFVVTDTGSQEAQQGCHDDRVIALGIAWQVRKRPVARGTTQRPEGW